MVALRRTRAHLPAPSPAPSPAGGRSARPLPHDKAAALVVPHAVLVQHATGWESAWLLACGSGTEGRRYLIQRDAGGSEPEWLAEGPLALPTTRSTTSLSTRPATRPARLPDPRRP